MPKTLTNAEAVRKHSLVGAPDECWPWQGNIDSDGYGKYSGISAHRRIRTGVNWSHVS